MKIIIEKTIVSAGVFPASSAWTSALKEIKDVIISLRNPLKGADFAIKPVKMGNGVVSIKKRFQVSMKKSGWSTEQPITLASGLVPGNLDFALSVPGTGQIAIEWETGNISSCHRSMNKLCLALVEKKIVAGVMIVPTKKLYKYLTDRVANYDELTPYFPFWGAIKVTNGILVIIACEHDREDSTIRLLKKGKDGRSKKSRKYRSKSRIKKKFGKTK